MSWEEEVEKIAQRRALARGQGGAGAVEKQHARGKLTIRERIDALIDPHSFREHGRSAGGAVLDENDNITAFTPANYVVGIGEIGSRRVAVGGEDFTLKGGSPNAAGLRKSVYAEHLAVKYRVPLVRLLEGGGGSVANADADPRKPRTVGQAVYEPHRFRIIAEAMGSVPIASAALGPVAGFPAGRLVASHFSVMTKSTAQVMVGGPALVKRALGRELSKEELGGAAIHARSGVVDCVVDDELAALEKIRLFLSYFPDNVWERAPRVSCDDPNDRCEDELLSIVPKNRRQAFDMRRVLTLIVDRDSFFELAPLYGTPLIVGFARINGQCVGISANDCRHLAGAMTAEAAQKMRRIIETCDTFHLPMVHFVDEPGFMIGPEAEANGTIRYGMAAVAAAATANIPSASVRVHKSFGVASAAHYGQDGYVLDWPSAASGPLPLAGGVAVAYGREIAKAPDPDARRQELEERLENAQNPFHPAESFAVHDIIDPRETRPRLCDWVDWIQPRLKGLCGERRFLMRP